MICCLDTIFTSRRVRTSALGKRARWLQRSKSHRYSRSLSRSPSREGIVLVVHVTVAIWLAPVMGSGYHLATVRAQVTPTEKVGGKSTDVGRT